MAPDKLIVMAVTVTMEKKGRYPSHWGLQGHHILVALRYYIMEN